MPLFKEKIQQDLTQAMKDRDELRVGTLRLLKSAIMKWEVSGSKKEINDEVVMELIQKEIKQRKDSIEQFNKGGRPDLAEKEEMEMAVLQAYLPEPMSEQRIREIVKNTMEENNMYSKSDIGKLMSAIMPLVKGKADGAMVRKVVEELLQ
ncbi:GatB/YqeY domain-containing protein [Candidatus Peregrinibacteria bacterium]|nr:GatB/YqeY domain-containing protein [Candidatus Peregrinibacteria bacterium]